MKILKTISEIIGKFMALIVPAIAALTLFVPQSSLWIASAGVRTEPALWI